MPPSQITLLCLCASHIDGDKRLHHLGLLLASISAQSTKTFKLFLGISFSNNRLKQEANQLLENNNRETIHTFLFSKRQPQFERYKSILNALRSRKHVIPEREPTTYLSFTDDDDLWSPHRMRVLYAGAQQIHADKRNPKYIFTRTQFRPEIERQPVTCWDELPTERQSTLWFDRPREYPDIVCKFTIYAQFFELASAELLGHPYCDVVFTIWLEKFTI